MNAWLTVAMGLIALAGGGGGIYSALTVKATKRKLTVEAEAVAAQTDINLTAAARDLVEPLRERVRELEAEVRELRTETRTLRANSDEADVLRARLTRAQMEIDALHAQIRDLKGIR